MPRRYTELTFTDDVKRAQRDQGVRAMAERMERAPVDDRTLGEDVSAFLAARDSFYMASVLQNGWPYLQHRGGPRGFVKRLDEHTLGFADYRGNRQLVSTGNVRGDDRVALFFMDYPGRRRLKLMAHAEVFAAGARPDLVERVQDTDDRARVERVVVLHVEAFDWNCPQHITPRYSLREIEELDELLPS